MREFMSEQILETCPRSIDRYRYHARLQQVAHGTAAGHQLVINRYDLFRSQLPMNLHKVLRVRRQACSCRFTPDTKRKFLVFL